MASTALINSAGARVGSGDRGGGGGAQPVLPVHTVDDGKKRDDTFFDDPLRLPFSGVTLMEADDDACLKRLQGIVKMGCREFSGAHARARASSCAKQCQ